LWAQDAEMPRRSPADLETQPVRLVAPSVPVDLPPPPPHLSPAMQGWWLKVLADYDLQPHHLRLLEAAADSWDRMTAARERLLAEGLTVEGKSGTKAHPCVNVERDARIAFSRLLRELDLDVDPPPERPVWRPPALRSNRRR
jgi:phage terminase small subunit